MERMIQVVICVPYTDADYIEGERLTDLQDKIAASVGETISNNTDGIFEVADMTIEVRND